MVREHFRVPLSQGFLGVAPTPNFLALEAPGKVGLTIHQPPAVFETWVWGRGLYEAEEEPPTLPTTSLPTLPLLQGAELWSRMISCNWPQSGRPTCSIDMLVRWKLYWNLCDREGSGEQGKGGQLWVERVLGPLLGSAYSGAMEGGTSQESAGAGRPLHISILLLPLGRGGRGRRKRTTTTPYTFIPLQGPTLVPADSVSIRTWSAGHTWLFFFSSSQAMSMHLLPENSGVAWHLACSYLSFAICNSEVLPSVGSFKMVPVF